MPPGEFELIGRYFRRDAADAAVAIGIGDDAAVLRVAEGHELVLAVDMMVESRHFVAGTDPEALGHKILAVNLSDLAAMGARPRWALLAGALPDADAAWLEPFARGLFALAAQHDVTLVGGDTTRGPRNLCLTIAGELPAGAAVRRSGATPGDDVWVSGSLGDAMLALAALEGRTSLSGSDLVDARLRLERPTPRVALGIALRGIATSMIDVSDGLTGDLGHIVEASGVAADVLVERLPRSAALAARLAGDDRALALACLLAGGDDYELCFTAPPSRRERVRAAAAAANTPVSLVGSITPSPRGAVVVRDERGEPIAAPRGFDHFA